MNFCLGTVQFGMDYGVQGNGKPDFKSVSHMLCFAVDNGIDCFDTAAAYGNAEQVLGRFADNYPDYAKRMCVVSKLHPKAFEGQSSSQWGGIALERAKESLATVKAERFYAYLFHNAQYIFEPDAVAALHRVKTEGLTERIGVSVYSPEEALKALEYPEIEVIQIPYNVFDLRLDRAGFFDRAEKQDVTVFARSSLLQGLAVMEPDKLPKHMRFAKPYLEKFRTLCEQYAVTPLQAAISYVGQHPHIDYVVFGVDNEAQLREYLAMRDAWLLEKAYDVFQTAFEDAEEKLVNPVLWNKEV